MILVRLFAEQQGRSLVEINLERFPQLASAFRRKDPHSLVNLPEAVDTYARSRRLKDVSEVHKSVIGTYREDFPKYIGARNLFRIKKIFNFAARNVGSKVKYSQFSSMDKSATVKTDIELLCMARVLAKVVHSHCSGLPLQADTEEKFTS